MDVLTHPIKSHFLRFRCLIFSRFWVKTVLVSFRAEYSVFSFYVSLEHWIGPFCALNFEYRNLFRLLLFPGLSIISLCTSIKLDLTRRSNLVVNTVLITVDKTELANCDKNDGRKICKYMTAIRNRKRQIYIFCPKQ